MDQKDQEERRRLVAKGARKQLAEGTWPQVMMVFGYPTPKAPITADEEFARLKTFYEQASCPNMAAFIDMVRFAEKENGMSMSFNLSLRRRLTPGEAPETTPENAMLLFLCPDILVGTRWGIEGAAIWFKNFSEAIPQLVPESVQVMDKIFGEAVEFLKRPSHKTNVAEMFKSAVLGEGKILETPKVSKH